MRNIIQINNLVYRIIQIRWLLKIFLKNNRPSAWNTHQFMRFIFQPYKVLYNYKGQFVKQHTTHLIF
jgi:hypothetical protein